MNAALDELGPTLVEGAGIFLLAFFGADALFGPEAAGLHDLALLIPALTLAITVVAYRLTFHR
jgi:hypothetical protein